jgi:YVTN family beta-propeller protein/VCBS repeat-containing protein
VSIAPVNAKPVAGTPTVGTPNTSTGVVTGTVSATDTDGDPLTYSGSTTTSKGALMVSADGKFTYTPNPSARHAAAKNGAILSAKSDSITITATDGYGGTIAIPVSVTITPANSAPVAAVSTVRDPDPSTGVVSGSLSATDADGDSLSYSGTTTTSQGSVSVATNGSFTYTPTVTARNTATANTTDAFTLTVSDGYGGVAAVPVTVKVSPNRPPISTVTVGIPNITTGVVTGSVKSADPDNDSLSYSAPASTAKGAVSIDSSTGAFTFTPTTVARHTAAAPLATKSDKSDTFTMTISDGRGGTEEIPVTVAIRPLNFAPTGTATVGSLDPKTGVITGTINATDADGDALTYSGSTMTPEGKVVIDSRTGAFTYTPVARVDTVTDVISGFTSPAEIVFSPDGARAYVSDNKQNSVSVIDTATRTIVATIGGLASPTSLAITPNGSLLYVAEPNSVSVIDTATNTIAGHVSDLNAPTGETTVPTAMAISPDGTFGYVVTRDTNRNYAIAVVDVGAASNGVAKQIPLPKLSMGNYISVTFTPDGRYAYISADNNLIGYVFDTVAEQNARLPNGYGTRVFSQDGSRSYRIDYGNLDAFNAKGQQVATVGFSQFAGAPWSLALGGDESLLYGLGGKGEVYLFDSATLSALGRAKTTCASCGPSEKWPSNYYRHGIAVSPDGTTAYAVSPAGGKVLVLTTWFGPTTDSFNVTVTDGYGGTTTVPVTVSFVG